MQNTSTPKDGLASLAVVAGSVSYRARVARLVNHGFQRGKHKDRNDGKCTSCEKRIQTTRSWWIDGGGEYDDGWNGYCMACAEKRVIKDEELWASYADMGEDFSSPNSDYHAQAQITKAASK